MSWVPVVAAVSIVVAVVVLGFLAWEIVGKARRLRVDVDRLQDLANDLATLQGEAVAVQARISRSRQLADGG